MASAPVWVGYTDHPLQDELQNLTKIPQPSFVRINIRIGKSQHRNNPHFSTSFPSQYNGIFLASQGVSTAPAKAAREPAIVGRPQPPERGKRSSILRKRIQRIRRGRRIQSLRRIPGIPQRLTRHLANRLARDRRQLLPHLQLPPYRPRQSHPHLLDR